MYLCTYAVPGLFCETLTFSEVIICDGTFRSAPRLFLQLYVIFRGIFVRWKENTHCLVFLRNQDIKHVCNDV